MATVERSIEFFPDDEAFRIWLTANHELPQGIWIKFAKKDTGIQSLHYAEALEVALCFGWIDGQTKKIDDEYYLQGFTPRRARSPWSKRNIDKVERLIADGLMQPSGQAEIDRAKADGRWERAYDGQSKAEVPQDFLDELSKNKAAAAFFETLNAQNKYAVSYRLQDAKKPETRNRRIEKFVQMFADGKKFH